MTTDDENKHPEQEFIGKDDTEDSANVTNNILINNVNIVSSEEPEEADPESPKLNAPKTVPEEIGEMRSEDLDGLLIKHFKGRVVRKDLTKKLKEGANVPVYVLEYLLGMYCASDDDEVILQGLESVKKVLAENYVRPDEAEKVKSLIRERGTFKIIDKVGVKLNQKKDVYEASLSNIGIKDALMPTKIVKENEKLLTGGIWCIISIQYFFEEGQKTSPFSILTLKPIQMPSMDMDEIFTTRENFSTDQWMDALLRSIGMEPTNLEQREK